MALWATSWEMKAAVCWKCTFSGGGKGDKASAGEGRREGAGERGRRKVTVGGGMQEEEAGVGEARGPARQAGHLGRQRRERVRGGA